MAYQLDRISVLVIDDNMPMLELTKSLLLTFGIGDVICAQNGEIGFRRYCQYKPDIVISDWMMKPLDGISFAKLVRNDPGSPDPYVPVILMTGFSERRRVLQARDAGVTEFLVKPFNAKDLYRRIAQVIERPRQFVRSEDFFGPDRRRTRAEDYSGPLRRDTDSERIAAQEPTQQQAEAHATLEKIRRRAGLAKGDKFDLDDEGQPYTRKKGKGSGS